MLYVVIAFLWVSLLLYVLFGGADFGAGIVELFTSKADRKSTRKLAYEAIGPIWEANHMWLIIAIVILFVGFPDIYATMSLYLHIPMLFMLMGIIARGTAFAFRHNDAVIDNFQTIYNKIFVYSSFLTPFFLGIIAGSTVSGHIDPSATNFLDAYVFSWLSWFSVSVGLFTVAICGFLAAVYLIGEAENTFDRNRFIRQAKIMNIAAVLFGGTVFIAASFENIPIIDWLFGNIIGLAAMASATLSLGLLWWYLKKNNVILIRLLAGFQITMILMAITLRHFPNIVLFKTGQHLSLLEHSGHDKTIHMLGMALLLGSIFILPALFYLIYSFQKKGKIAGDYAA